MQKNIIIGLLLILVLMQFGYTASHSVDNPTLMHMHRREFIAASIAQGIFANGIGFKTPTEIAKLDLEYTDALMEALDR